MSISLVTNMDALRAGRALSAAQATQSTAIERLSTGLRINRASDDPAGIVAATELRTQLDLLSRASTNTQSASAVLQTVDVALSSISDQINTIISSIVSAQGGGDVAAEQETVDAALGEIDRIARSTRFGTRYLLNGNSALAVTARSNEIVDLNVRRADMGGAANRTFTLNVTQPASQAILDVADAGEIAARVASVVVRISGPSGTANINLDAGDTGADLSVAVNAVRDQTGVYYSSGNLYGEEFGTDATISTEQVGGSGWFSRGGGGGTNISAYQSNTGQDVAGTLDATTISPRGNHVEVAGNNINASFNLRAGTGVGSYTFTVTESGLLFQIGTQNLSADRLRLGVASTQTSFLGMYAETIGGQTTGGFLSTVRGGGINDLATDAANALLIANEASGFVARERAFFGTQINVILDPQTNLLENLSVEITNALGIVRDADVGDEATRLAIGQTLLTSATSSLAIANSTPGAIVSKLLAPLTPSSG